MSPSTSPAAPAHVRRAHGTGLVAALTFDDGPDPRATPRLLDLLRAHGIRAVFAVVGECILRPGGADLLRRTVAEGHVLCNHSTSFADMGDWAADRVRADLQENLRLIREVVGPVPVPFWRAPNGSWGVTAEVGADLGMRPLAVTNTIRDWETQDVGVLTARLREAMRPGELVLAHDGGGDRSGTVAAVEIVLAERLAAGWRFTLPVGC
ncbi:polysaccharide deacetylase family protein [Microbacterium sp. JZ31]|uniref:polysaccharide deacetylase family protein n=1 Tax=Microbacterium sp. JZ31 TaxID=1906274 RepID=UPI001933F88B|nr:polysaccharide deacetylase family protein [Microbacterium sp. JZ31]